MQQQTAEESLQRGRLYLADMPAQSAGSLAGARIEARRWRSRPSIAVIAPPSERGNPQGRIFIQRESATLRCSGSALLRISG